MESIPPLLGEGMAPPYSAGSSSFSSGCSVAVLTPSAWDCRVPVVVVVVVVTVPFEARPVVAVGGRVTEEFDGVASVADRWSGC